MKIANVTIAGVKADIAKREITVTMKMRMTPRTMAAAETMGIYTGEDADMVDVTIEPRQPELFSEAGVPPTIVGATDIKYDGAEINPPGSIGDAIPQEAWDKAFEQAEAEREKLVGPGSTAEELAEAINQKPTSRTADAGLELLKFAANENEKVVDTDPGTWDPENPEGLIPGEGVVSDDGDEPEDYTNH